MGEIDYLQSFLADLRALGTDSKFEQLTEDLNEMLKRRDSVIVFTQYTDTMDYLREKLCHVYGGQVACYSGRGGERWDGNAWHGTSKENIKTAFRENREIKILLCTESASEGLNLQTCGVLINYEMPWNPMRVEQRIGRIDRIGQEYDRVWIGNYFYDGTVEATVYQRLDDRIASFESVVGERRMKCLMYDICGDACEPLLLSAFTPRLPRRRRPETRRIHRASREQAASS